MNNSHFSKWKGIIHPRCEIGFCASAVLHVGPYANVEELEKAGESV